MKVKFMDGGHMLEIKEPGEVPKIGDGVKIGGDHYQVRGRCYDATDNVWELACEKVGK